MWETIKAVAAWIRDHWPEIRDWFGRGPNSPDPVPGIILLGAGGTIETLLGHLLAAGLQGLFEVASEYKESLDIEKHALKDDPSIEIVVGQGQAHCREQGWAEFLQDIANGRYRGVILVNAYGYHYLRHKCYKDLPLYQSDKVVFLRRWIEDRR